MLLKKKDINLIKSSIKRNNIEFKANKKNSVSNSNNSNKRLILALLSNYIKLLLKWLTYVYTK